MNWPGMNAVARLRAQRVVPVRRVRVAEMLDDAVLPVDQRHAPVQIRNHDAPLLFVEMARQPEALDEIDVRTVERKALEPIVAPIRDDEDRSCRRACRPRCRAARSVARPLHLCRRTCGCTPLCCCTD